VSSKQQGDDGAKKVKTNNLTVLIAPPSHRAVDAGSVAAV
jgi:hypothetical protein